MQRRRKRKSKRNDLAGRKEIESEGVDFLPFLAGMVSSLAIIFLIWNHLSTSQATEPVIAAPVVETPTVDPNDFNAVIESGDVELLANLLLELGQKPDDKNPAELVVIYLQCFEIADQMLAMDLSRAQEKFAKGSKLKSLSKIYGLNLVNKLNTPNVAQDIREVATSYLNDPDSKLVKDARLALFKVNVFEQQKLKSAPSVEPIADEIVELLELYPDDEIVISTIRLVLKVYLDDYITAGRLLIENLCDRKNELSSSKAKAICLDFSDKVLLVDARYQQLFDDRWAKGEVGQRELLIKSIELIKNRGVGELLIMKVDDVAHWFEQQDRYDSAIKIYDAMLKSAENAANPEAASLAREAAVAGLTRNKLVNKKIDLSGFALDGSPILPGEFQQRTVVLVFWSNHNLTSINSLRQFHRETQAWKSKPITVLVICIDKNSLEDVKRIAADLKRFRFMVGDPAGDGTIPVLEQCPSHRVPRALLIGKDGTVVDVNVPMGELKTDAEGI